MISLYKVHLPENMAQVLEPVLRSGFISEGPQAKKFEQEFQKYVGNPNTALMNSCTSALTIALRIAGVGVGTEVISSPMTCLATNEPVLALGGKVVWCDVDPTTGNIDADKIEELITDKTKAILFVDWAGTPAELDKINAVAKKYGLKTIEDAAHAIGSKYKGDTAGTGCDFSAFSFQAIKHLTSVTPETPVLIRQNSKDISLVNIGSLNKEQIVGQECLSFLPNGKTKWSRIYDYIEHPIDDIILKIKTEKGRTVKVTRTHSVFTYKGGSFVKTAAESLKEGDYLAVPRRLDINSYYKEDEYETIDILDLLPNEVLCVRDGKVKLSYEGRGSNAGKWISRYLVVDEDLCKILGYYSSEGSMQKYSRNGKGDRLVHLIFSFGSHEENTHVKDVIQLLEKKFPSYKGQKYKVNPNKTGMRVIFGGSFLAKVMAALKPGKDVYTKRVPEIIWKANKKCQIAFIDGFLNGDGHYRCQDSYTPYESFNLASKDLVNGIHYLLLTQGIYSSLSEGYSKKDNKKYKYYHLDIINRNSLGPRQSQSQSKENCIPNEFVDKYNNHSSFTISRILKENLSCPSNLLEDIALLKITSIESKKYTGNVYDFSVEETENFIGGYGAICLHNTVDGGALACKSAKDYERAILLRWFGLARGHTTSPVCWDGDVVEHGYKCHMNDVNATIGLEQLKYIDGIVGTHRANGNFLLGALGEVKGIEACAVPDYVDSSFWFFTILTEGLEHKERINKKLTECGIGSNITHTRNDKYSLFKGCEVDMPGLDLFSERMLNIPCGWWCSSDDMNYIVESLKKV